MVDLFITVQEAAKRAKPQAPLQSRAFTMSLNNDLRRKPINTLPNEASKKTCEDIETTITKQEKTLGELKTIMKDLASEVSKQ